MWRMTEHIPAGAGYGRGMPSHVVIAGGGVAGVEALLALRDLAEDRARITVVSPEADFEVKPLRTAEPFSVDHVRHHDLADLCRQRDAAFVQDALASVDVAAKKATLAGGDTLDYDALVLA